MVDNSSGTREHRVTPTFVTSADDATDSTAYSSTENSDSGILSQMLSMAGPYFDVMEEWEKYMRMAQAHAWWVLMIRGTRKLKHHEYVPNIVEPKPMLCRKVIPHRTKVRKGKIVRLY